MWQVLALLATSPADVLRLLPARVDPDPDPDQDPNPHLQGLQTQQHKLRHESAQRLPALLHARVQYTSGFLLSLASQCRAVPHGLEKVSAIIRQAGEDQSQALQPHTCTLLCVNYHRNLETCVPNVQAPTFRVGSVRSSIPHRRLMCQALIEQISTKSGGPGHQARIRL